MRLGDNSPLALSPSRPLALSPVSRISPCRRAALRRAPFPCSCRGPEAEYPHSHEPGRARLSQRAAWKSGRPRVALGTDAPYLRQPRTGAPLHVVGHFPYQFRQLLSHGGHIPCSGSHLLYLGEQIPYSGGRITCSGGKIPLSGRANPVFRQATSLFGRATFNVPAAKSHVPTLNSRIAAARFHLILSA